MGNFYVNFTMRCDDVTAVANLLKRQKRDAFLATDSKSGCVVAFDSAADEQDPAVIQKLGKSLSKGLGCIVLTVANEDDDVLRYWIFWEGKILDTFDSGHKNVSDQNFLSADGGRVIIAKFDPANPVGDRDLEKLDDWKPPKRRKGERGGDAQLLADAFDVSEAAGKVMDILLKDYDFALDQHRALCKVLGTPQWAAGGNFGRLAAGELPKGLRKSQIVRVG